ncbi:hypothetical protein EJB05_09462, partial [Eragrostis curvula]
MVLTDPPSTTMPSSDAIHLPEGVVMVLFLTFGESLGENLNSNFRMGVGSVFDTASSLEASS